MTRACLPAMPDIAGLAMGTYPYPGATGIGTDAPLGKESPTPVPNIVPGVMCGE